MSTRLQTERAFHDQQAAERAVDLTDARLRFDDACYLDHAPWIRPAFRHLGVVRGKRLLDLGCGHGMAAVVLARRGARVTALDLSGGYLRETCRRAQSNGVVLQTVQADAERLPFRDQTFDGIWGSAILHHLDLPHAARELERVLRPGGRAVFCEPWGGNPLLRWARTWAPYPQKSRTPDEQPLDAGSLSALRGVFPQMAVYGNQLLGMFGRLLNPESQSRILARWDTWLLRCYPGLHRWCRYVVVVLSKNNY